MRSGSVGTANAYRKADDVFRSHVVVRYVTRPLFMPLPRPPLPLSSDTPLPTAMPLSDMRQVNSSLLRLETASADLVCQRETTDKLVKSLLERLGLLQCYGTGLGRVRDPEGARKKSRSRSEADWKSFGVDGKQKDLASTCALRPHAHRCPISESRSDRKGNRGNRSRYSDWRYRRKHLSIYTNYVFHLEQVWRDREWRS